MDKIFQKICDLYPHYRINTKIKKKIFYIVFTLFKSFISGPIRLNFGKFFFYSYPQRKNYSRSLLSKVALHDERDINFFIKNIDDKSIFIDCGANQGFYTIPIAASNKNCKIIAFEPSVQEMEYLNQNISLNNIKNIETSYLGIGDKEGSFKFKNDNLEKNSTKGGLIIEDENETISRIYQNTANIKIGAELRVNPILLRTGYARYGSTFVNSIDIASENYCFGLGIDHQVYIFDVSYILSESTTEHILSNNNIIPVIDTKHSMRFTLGLRF